jgi:hypothetical protein
MTSTPHNGSGPTALRIQLGTKLRRLRKSRNLSRETAGWEIRASESKISRMELGRVPFKERDIADLLSLYGVGDEERSALMTLARQANAPERWQQFGDVVPPWFLSYLGLEEAASVIRTYESHFVPGLLQTQDYARAVIEQGHANAPVAEIAKRIGLRQDRQKVLARPDPPHLWAVLDESVLCRRIGGRDVMQAQLQALIEASARPNVRLQIVPLRSGAAAAGCPFTILRFAEPELPDVVYVEHLTSAVYLDKPGDVDQYLATMERTCLEAVPPHHAAVLLRRALDEISHSPA